MTALAQDASAPVHDHPNGLAGELSSAVEDVLTRLGA
jgi:hypothetical protein